MTKRKHDLSEVYTFIYDLVPTDIGVERIGDYVVYFEGFHQECLDDVNRRMSLPKNDKEYVESIDQVFEQVWQEFKDNAKAIPIEENVNEYEYGEPIVYSIFYKPEISENSSLRISESTLRILGLTNLDVSTLLVNGMIIENKSYRNLDSILSEAVLYENFLNSVKQFLQARYDETVDDVALRLRNTKDAGVLIKEIMSDADLLDRVLIQLNKQLRVMLRTLNAKITELRTAAQATGGGSVSAASLQQFYNLVNNLVNRSIRVRGWQGFLISLGTHTVLKFTILQINELKTIAAQLNFFSTQQSTTLINKIEDISRLSVNISATTMMNYMGIFTEVVGLVNVMLDTLSNIRRKLQIGANITLATNPMQESILRNEFEFWRNLQEDSSEPEKKSAGKNERLLLSAILTLHDSVIKNQGKDVASLAFDVSRYFNLPIKARELAEKYKEIVKNGIVQLGDLVKIRNQWALVSKLDPERIIAIYPNENEKPPTEWIEQSLKDAAKTTVTVQLKELKSINKEYAAFSSDLSEIHEIPVDKSAAKDWIKDYTYWDTNIKNKNAKDMGEFLSYQVYWIPYPYKIEIVALDRTTEEAVVMMSLRKLNSDFYQVDKVATNESHAGKGLAHKLYRKIILDGIKLMSDTEQSPGGKRIWLELARMSDVKIYGIDYNQTPPVYTDVRIDNNKLYGDYDLYTSHIIEKLDKKRDQIKDSIAILRSDIDRAINSDGNIKHISRMEHELEKLETELERLEYYNPEDSRDYMRKVRLAAVKNSDSVPYKKQAQLTEVEFLPDYDRNRDRDIPTYDSAVYGIKMSGSKKIGTIKGLSIYLEPVEPSKFGKQAYT